MSKFFVPYSKHKPAVTVINGHRLVICSKDRDAVEDSLELVGADHVKVLRLKEDTAFEEEAVLTRIAKRAKSGIVVAPSEIPVVDLINDLRVQLPWIQ